MQSLSLIFKDSKSAMLHGVSILELCLIVAMKHICEINGDVPFNFEMVYNGMCVCMHLCLRCECNTMHPHACMSLCVYKHYFLHSEYKKFTQRSHSVEFFSKPVALKVHI